MLFAKKDPDKTFFSFEEPRSELNKNKLPEVFYLLKMNEKKKGALTMTI